MIDLASRPDPSDDGTRRAKAARVLFAAIAVLMLVDLAADLSAGTTLLHVLVEAVVLALAAVGAFSLDREVRRARRDLLRGDAEADRARAEAAHWRAESEAVLRGLGAAIARQFRAWGLSPAEAEVALMLLKGLSLGEIARMRGTGERTSRDQARAVYRKASVSGRAELSAWFLEDLMLPDTRHATSD